MDMFYEIDFRTLEHHKGIEDFRITNEDDSKICIGEAKGKHRDIMKPDLLKFEANGVAVGKDQSLFLYSHQKDSSDSSSRYHTNATTPSRDGEEELGLVLYARTYLSKYD